MKISWRWSKWFVNSSQNVKNGSTDPALIYKRVICTNKCMNMTPVQRLLIVVNLSAFTTVYFKLYAFGGMQFSPAL